MNKAFLVSLISFLVSLPVLSGCSSTPKAISPPQIEASVPSLASSKNQIDIQYTLGRRDHYRFYAMDEGDTAKASTYLNRQILDEGAIDRNQFENFLKKVLQYVQESPKATNGPCRSPFTIQVKIENKVSSASGCRSDDHGRLSRLIQEGEFLLYSKN